MILQTEVINLEGEDSHFSIHCKKESVRLALGMLLGFCRKFHCGCVVLGASTGMAGTVNVVRSNPTLESFVFLLCVICMACLPLPLESMLRGEGGTG